MVVATVISTKIIGKIAPMMMIGTNSYKGSMHIKKCPKKWKKSTIFLPPPLHQDVLDFFELGKILNFGTPPLKKRKHKLKTLEISVPKILGSKPRI